jgi:hypothetical protein
MVHYVRSAELIVGSHFVYRARILLYSEASSGVLGIGIAAADCRSLDPAIEFGLFHPPDSSVQSV